MKKPERPIAIVDTNILSYAMGGAALAFTYARLLAEYDARISFMTSAEIYYGAEKGRWAQRRRLELENLLRKYPVAPYEEGMERLYARIMAERAREGRRLDEADAWIAATAVHYDAPLATNDKNFLRTPGLKVIMADEADLRVLPPLRPGARPARPLDMNCHCGL